MRSAGWCNGRARLGRRHVLSAGTDFRWVDGDSVEDAFDTVTGSTKTLHRVAGGTQRSLGLFVQDVFAPAANVTVTASARLDRWRNYDAHNTETILATGAVNDPVLPDKSDSVVSPRLGVLYRVHERVSVWGDMAAGFRAPTLNELYRRFSLGAVVTLANPELGPERLTGGELGVNVIRDAARDLAHDVVRQSRQGSRGERHDRPAQPAAASEPRADADPRPADRSSTGASAGRCVSPGRISTTRRACARTPRTRPWSVFAWRRSRPIAAAFQLQYSDPRFVTVAFDLQASGEQFDDDLNTRRACCRGTRWSTWRVARLRTKPRGVRRRAEHVRRGVLRRFAAHAHRAAAAAECRCSGEISGALSGSLFDPQPRVTLPS